MAQRAIGIDVSDREVRAILVEGSAKKQTVIGFAAEPISAPAEGESTEDSFARALKAAVEGVGSKKDPVALALGSSNGAFRQLSLPFVGKEQVRKVVKFELEGQIHQWSIDEVVVDFYTVSEEKGQSQLLVSAMPKSYLRGVLKACEKAGFDPLVADLDATAIFNSALSSGVLDQEGSYLLVHVGQVNALLLVIQNRVLQQARSIRVAVTQKTSPPEQADVTAPAGATPSQEPAAAETASLPEDSQEEVFVAFEEEFGAIGGYAKNAASLIVREAKRSLASLRLEQPLLGIYLSGSWESLEGLRDNLQSQFQQEPFSFDLFDRVEHTLPAEQAAQYSSVAPAAYGAALKLLDVDAAGIDLRQEDLRFSRRFDQIKAELAVLVFVLAFVFLMENIWLFKKNQTHTQSYQVLFEEASKKIEGLTDKKPKLNPNLDPLRKISQLRVNVESEFKTLKDRVGQASDFKQPQSAFEAWYRLFSAIQEVESKLGDFLIEKLDFKYTEPTSSREPFVSIKMDFVFLGEPQGVAVAAGDELLSHFKSKKDWEVSPKSDSFQPLPQGGGIIKHVELDMKVRELNQ